MAKRSRAGLILIIVCILAVAGWLLISKDRHPSAASQSPGSAFRSGEDLFFVDLAESPKRAPLKKESLLKSIRSAMAGPTPVAALKIDYPSPSSLFPPDMTAPTFLFHDSADEAKAWLVDIAIAGEKGHIFVLTDGRRPKEEIDPRLSAPDVVYEPPIYQASAKGWTASGAIWDRLTRRPEKDIAVTFYGLADPEWSRPAPNVSLLSQGTIGLRISKDPVTAPIFYRDVPLMPIKNDKGIIMPVPESAFPLIEWRIRDLSKPAGAVVMKDIPTCVNCHSFSNDGRVMGMDVDSSTGDKGGYTIAPVQARTVIEKEQVFTWSSYNPGRITNGLFARVSPDGRYVISSVNENIFVTNYLDVRYLQTFYPTRGILAFYDRTTGKIAALPGADNPEYVQSNAAWTPDSRSLIFIRAKAMDHIPPGPRPLKANDPNEIQIKFDLFTIPFNDGRGGEAKPLPGASANGMSNSFPKISPDGRWIVWVEAANGLLMRPDGKLYIMPLSGGRPRRMDCNLSNMNSWHSWSPNSRWLVFSSKANTPYTQMFLTHIDEQGNDSPAILVPNSTAANRAVNIPEFINIKPDGLAFLDFPALEYLRHLWRAEQSLKTEDLDTAFKELRISDQLKPGFPGTLAAFGEYFRRVGDLDRAGESYEKALALNDGDATLHHDYGVVLFLGGKYEKAVVHFQTALKSDPSNPQTLSNLGAVELARGELGKAKGLFEQAVKADPKYAKAHFNLALVQTKEGKFRDALTEYEKCLEIKPDDVQTLEKLAWLYATCKQDGLRNGRRALELARKLERFTKIATALMYDILAAAYAEAGQFSFALQMAENALQLTKSEDPGLGMRRRLIDLYKSGQAYHGQPL